MGCRLSCLPVSLYGEFVSGQRSIIPWAAQLVTYGVDGMDISPFMLGNSISDDALKHVKRELESIGLPVAMYVTYSDFTNPSIPISLELAALELQYKRASLLGAQLIRITVGQEYPHLSTDWVHHRLEPVFNEIEHLSHVYGVKAVLENHGKPKNWNYRDYTADRGRFLALLPLMGSMGLNFDTANPVINGYDTLELLNLVYTRVVSVHAADTAEYGAAVPVVTGNGVVPIRKVLGTLHERGFDGWICIEETSGLGDRGIEQSIVTMQEYIRKEIDQ